MSKPVVGAQLFTCREFTKTIPDIVETFRKVKDIGYTEVQISAFGPVDPAELGKVISDSGLKVAITHMSWGRFRDDLDGVINDHKLWNCVHTAVGGIPKEYFNEAGVKRFIDELGPIVERLRAEGMDFSYHNHSAELMRIGDRTFEAALLEDAPADLLNFEIDTYWIQAGGGDPADWLRKCKGRCPAIHLKDMGISMEREQLIMEIGEGNLNWPNILAACEEAGVESMLVEQDRTYGKDPFECLATSYRNLKALGYS